LVLTAKIKILCCEELEMETFRILVSKFGVSFEILTRAKDLFDSSKKYELKNPTLKSVEIQMIISC